MLISPIFTHLEHSKYNVGVMCNEVTLEYSDYFFVVPRCVNRHWPQEDLLKIRGAF